MPGTIETPLTLTGASTGLFVSIFISEEGKYRRPRAEIADPWDHFILIFTEVRTHCIRYCIFDVFVYTSESLQIACSTNYPVRFLSNLITFDMSFRWCFPNVNLVKISLRVLFGARDVPRQSEKFADVAKKIYDYRSKFEGGNPESQSELWLQSVGKLD